jgi:hypothetical protein
VSIFTYTLKVGSNQYCKALNDRTIAIVDIVEAKEREQRMVTLQAGEMENPSLKRARLRYTASTLTSTRLI